MSFLNHLFGSTQSLDDNQEVESESGSSRLGNSIFCALCVAPFLILGMVIMVGWNEKRAVCEERAIIQGKNEVDKIKCTDTTSSDGGLVMLSCDLDPDSVTLLSLPAGTDFSTLSVQGTGLKVTAEMYQCEETVTSKTQKNAVGGGTTTVKTYTYSKAWKSYRVDSGSFRKKDSDDFRKNCNTENPPWPSAVPESGTKYGKTAKVGSFTIENELVQKVPLDADVNNFSAPLNWTKSSSYYESSKWEVSSTGAAAGIGQVRVQLRTNDWSEPTATVLGKNTKGTINKWTADDSWGCSGFTLHDLRMGVKDKDTLFEELEGESTFTTWAVRLLGFLVLWCAFSLCAAPLEVVADCIPFVGPYLGDAIEAIACVVCCCPACACCLGVAGLVWVAMRPMIGIPLMLIFICTMGGMIALKCYSKRKKEEEKKEEEKKEKPLEDVVVMGIPVEKE